MTRRSKATREEVITVLQDFERRGLVHRTGKSDKHGFPIFEFDTLEAVTEFFVPFFCKGETPCSTIQWKNYLLPHEIVELKTWSRRLIERNPALVN
jgi:hypothetical protein